MKKEAMDDYLDLEREIEIKKKSVVMGEKEHETLRLNGKFLELVQREKRKSFQDLVKQSKYGDKVKCQNGKLRIKTSVVLHFFENTVNQILNHVEEIFKDSSLRDCRYILMVGGFSESKVLQEAVKTKFNHDYMKIIIPEEASVCVMKGAVVFGHQPKSVTTRVSKYTYGVAATHTYNKNKCVHGGDGPEEDDNGDLRCYDIFKKLLCAGQLVSYGEELKECSFSPITNR